MFGLRFGLLDGSLGQSFFGPLGVLHEITAGKDIIVSAAYAQLCILARCLQTSLAIWGWPCFASTCLGKDLAKKSSLDGHLDPIFSKNEQTL